MHIRYTAGRMNHESCEICVGDTLASAGLEIANKKKDKNIQQRGFASGHPPDY